MRVLLVWNEVPGRLRFFEIEDPTREQLKMLELADGKYINCDDENEGMIYLNLALADADYSNGEEHAGIWKDNGVDTPVGGPIDRVFHSGCCL